MTRRRNPLKNNFTHRVPSTQNTYQYSYQVTRSDLAKLRMPRGHVTSPDNVVNQSERKGQKRPRSTEGRHRSPPQPNRGDPGRNPPRGASRSDNRGRPRGRPVSGRVKTTIPKKSSRQTSNYSSSRNDTRARRSEVISNDVWTIPNNLLLTFQSFPWVQFFSIKDGSWVFPKNFETDPEKYDVYRLNLDLLILGLLLNPPFSKWDEFAEFFLQLAMNTNRYYVMIAPNQPKYPWYNKWFLEENTRPFFRIDLLTPLAFQKGLKGEPCSLAPHTTSIFFLGLQGPNVTLRNDSSGFIYPNANWLRLIAHLNNLSSLPYYQTSYHISDRLEVLTFAENYRGTEDMAQELIDFEPPAIIPVPISTTPDMDSVFSANRSFELPSHWLPAIKFTSRQQRKARRVVRSLGEQLDLFPKGPKNFKYWPDPTSVPPVCKICGKQNHPPSKCTKRVLREDECLFSTYYEHLLFRYVTLIHKPYVPLRRAANEGILFWMENEMTRLTNDAKAFRISFVQWAREETGDPSFDWKIIPTYNFSEALNGIDFWAAIGTPIFVLQRLINGFRAEMTMPAISFEIKNRNSPEKIKDLYELHTKPYLEERKICIVPDWFPQVVFSRFLVEEPRKKRPILDCSPMTQFTLCNHFELPPPHSHENSMPNGFIFAVDATGCFCNCWMRHQDRRYLCFFDEYIQQYLAYQHAAFGFAAGPEYADTLMGPIRNWMRFGFAVALWIDDMSFIWDKLDLTAEELMYMLRMILQLFAWLRIRLNEKCILQPKRELPFTGVRLNTLHCKVFVQVKKLRKIWEVIQLIQTQDKVTVRELQSLVGKCHWCMGKSRPLTLSTLQEWINDLIRQNSKKYPSPNQALAMNQALNARVPVPEYLTRMMHEILRYVEMKHFQLTRNNPETWFLITDAGEMSAGGFAYNQHTCTQHFLFDLPQELRPSDASDPAADLSLCSSGTRELWGLLQVLKTALDDSFQIVVNIRVDNMSVLTWIQNINPAKMALVSPYRAKLVREFYEFCTSREITWLIDHHPRDQPLARFADFLSKRTHVHQPWNQSNTIVLTKRGLKKIQHLVKWFKLPSSNRIFNDNIVLPWKDFLVQNIPMIKPLKDMLTAVSVLCIPYGFHRAEPYEIIIANLKRYRFTGFIICPGFSHARNIFRRSFTTYRQLTPGLQFHFTVPKETENLNTAQFAYFMKNGLCW